MLAEHNNIQYTLDLLRQNDHGAMMLLDVAVGPMSEVSARAWGNQQGGEAGVPCGRPVATLSQSDQINRLRVNGEAAG